MEIKIKRNTAWASKYIEITKKYKQNNEWLKNNDEELKDFLQGKDVASVGRSYFPKNKYEAIFKFLKENEELIDTIKSNTSIETGESIYKKFEESVINAGGGRNCLLAVHAMITALQPKILCNIVNEDRLDDLYKLLIEQIEEIDTSESDRQDPTHDDNNNGTNVWQFVTLNKGWEDLKQITDWQVKSWYEKSSIIYNFFKSNNYAFNENEQNNYSDIPWAVLMALNGDKRCAEIAKRLIIQKNIILTGAPGTGKTFMAQEIAQYLITIKQKENPKPTAEDFKKQIDFVQFHPSYDYSDFVEGLRPAKKDSDVTFERMDGQFKAFCGEAAKKENSNKSFVFIIDEINRGEISKIFGELFFAIDPGYRDGGKNKTYVKTQYHQIIEKKMDEQSARDDYQFKTGFYVPSNVYIIGTMNDIDRSVDSMDIAFRRRFAFIDISASDSETIIYNSDLKMSSQRPTYTMSDLINRMESLNNAIIDPDRGELTPEYQIGGAYFLKIKDVNYSFDRLWNEFIEGVVTEYYRGRPDQAKIVKQLKAAYNLEDIKS